MKTFLGTVNYHSSIVNPSQELLKDYLKSRTVAWTPETEECFKNAKFQISKGTTTHFISDTAPIMLHTDACDCGVVIM